MATFTIEGDIVGIQDIQLQFVKDSIEAQGFKEANVMFEPVGGAGDNYTAAVKRITITDNQNRRTLKMIAKFATNMEILREMANLAKLFKNEHIVYTKLFPKLDQLQQTARIPEEDRFKHAAFYGSLQQEPFEVILLEDLKELGYRMLDRFTSLTNECVRSVLKSLATLHSLSYAMKKKDAAYFEELKKELFDLWLAIASEPETRKFFDHIEENVMPMLEKDVHKKTVKGMIDEMMSESIKNAKVNRDSEHAVFQQGDAWTNNIMFKIDDPTNPETLMIDYQLVIATNPVIDLLYMIFACTDYEARKAHYHDWIDYYHKELDNSLSYFGLKANSVYTRDQLDADLKRHGKWSLGKSIVTASMLIRKNEEAEIVKKAMQSADIDSMIEQSSADKLTPETIALFKVKVEGLIDSHLELGYV